MSEVRSVLYTGAFRFPDQDAAAFRVFSIAQLWKASGWNVAFAGWERAPEGVTQYVYCGHDCFSQDEFRSGPVNPVRRVFGFLFRGHKTVRWIWKNRDKFGAIVAYNPPALFAVALLLMGKLFGIKIVLDSTEWYESDHLPGGYYGLASFENWLRMNLVYKFFNHVICISSFLEKHFQSKNIIRIPPLLPSDKLVSSLKPNIRQGISLIYAGEAGKKDLLATLIASLPGIQEKICVRIQLHIVGMNWLELSELVSKHGFNPDLIRSFVVCHGRVPRDEVLQLYSVCHFSVLFREIKRYALAGFPTKAMESLANGCPIITNAVGDLAKLASNGVNAFVLEESQLERQLPALLNQAMSEERYALMAVSARNTAMDCFSPYVYKDRFSVFSEAAFGRTLKG